MINAMTSPTPAPAITPAARMRRWGRTVREVGERGGLHHLTGDMRGIRRLQLRPDGGKLRCLGQQVVALGGEIWRHLLRRGDLGARQIGAGRAAGEVRLQRRHNPRIHGGELGLNGRDASVDLADLGCQ